MADTKAKFGQPRLTDGGSWKLERQRILLSACWTDEIEGLSLAVGSYKLK